MKIGLFQRVLPALLLAAAATAATATPLKVQAVGETPQIVLLCPKCGAPIACAKVGDYTIAFTADLLTPGVLGFVRLTIRVTDKAGAPVNDANVALAASMAGHWHELVPPLKVESRGEGKYETTTSRLGMRGTWNAEVVLTTATGDTVKQRFTFVFPQ